MNRERLFAPRLKTLIQPRSFSRFAIVGVINTCAGVGLYPLIDWLTGRVIGHYILLLVTYILCTTSAFLLHRFFTFKSRGSFYDEVMRYVVLSSLTFGVNFLLLHAALSCFPWSADIAQTVISTVLSALLMVANYFGLNHLVFKKAKLPTKVKS